MDYSRRNFLKTIGLVAGGTGIMNALPLPIQVVQKAMAINPDKGTTFMDAEHVVMLMQENRSFDHVYGSLQGVRGFNDPRTIRLPDNNLCWLQTDKKGDTFLPYRLDIKDSKVTWIGGLPHQWGDQVEARNEGRYDKWLDAKSYDGKMPFTLGYYNRHDLPFYYALADAFTIGDHHFCSSLTGTTPNRLYYWTGTVREEQHSDSPANISNSFVNYSNNARWKTFPETLEEENISWKVYQNELSLGVGLKGEAVAWLENFTNNPLEWFEQYHVRFHPAHVKHLQRQAGLLDKELAEMGDNEEERAKKEQLLKRFKAEVKKYSRENFEKLPKTEQNLHKKAFTTNINDPLYHEMSSLKYEENGEERELQLPKGDPLYQFRKDVNEGKLPTVSWLIGSQRLSDHPSSPMFGAWYVSEAIKILTENPEVWKKTIFILTYDENDGYFDHIPPFTAPDPEDKSSGFCSQGIDPAVEYVTNTEVENLKGKPKDPGRSSPIGMGYRIPFVVASPWSRGGKVNSQLSDNTSILMFLEKFLSHKKKKPIKVDNISSWRRAISSDLTSIFEEYNGQEIKLPEFIKKEPFVKDIYNAKFKAIPGGYKKLSPEEIKEINSGNQDLGLMPEQEKGSRKADPLPYEFYVKGKLSNNGFEIEMEASDEHFKEKASGAAFYVYTPKPFTIRNYAVKPGDKLTDNWELTDNAYELRLYGSNGFFREFKGNTDTPDLIAWAGYEQSPSGEGLTGNLELHLEGKGSVEIIDNAYGQDSKNIQLKSGKEQKVVLDLSNSQGWYDITVRYKEEKNSFIRLAGHVETGKASITDPFMGRDGLKA